MFYDARKFNSNISSWKIQNGTLLTEMLKYAQSFNYKTSLDRSWRVRSNTYPGSNMFDATCSTDPTCGSCGRADTTGRSVACRPHQGALPADKICHLCADYGSECCAIACPRGSFNDKGFCEPCAVLLNDLSERLLVMQLILSVSSYRCPPDPDSPTS